MSDRFPNLGAMPSRQSHAPSTSTGAASAQAGMVRIQRGSETRYVWPVHLPGWLAMGWQVGGGEISAAATAALPVVVTPGSQAPRPVAAAIANRSTSAAGGQRPAAAVGIGSTGQGTSPASAPQPIPATTNPVGGDASKTVAVPASSPPAAADSPRQPQADLTAHLPTNLLGLDQEDTTAQQVTPSENDAGSAWNLAPGPADHSADAAGAVDPASELVTAASAAEAESEQELQTAPDTDTPAAASTTAAAEPVAAGEEVAAQPAPARRGRPRKVRPEIQPEATTEPTDQEHQPPASDGIEAQQTPTALLSTEGDDPFGMDPLL